MDSQLILIDTPPSPSHPFPPPPPLPSPSSPNPGVTLPPIGQTSKQERRAYNSRAVIRSRNPSDRGETDQSDQRRRETDQSDQKSEKSNQSVQSLPNNRQGQERICRAVPEGPGVGHKTESEVFLPLIISLISFNLIHMKFETTLVYPILIQLIG